ncbi:MAG: hypothetical protein F4Y39_11835 [Gemmatimonadetes bacterium]|nr:hypothetical protein [Gemmatimonadota bacterium]MYC14408.1 hypothetical protein [Gemmatimonadota bacterium]MYF72874.1 hypothetical protein [Gemmatimonadota bacterium]
MGAKQGFRAIFLLLFVVASVMADVSVSSARDIRFDRAGVVDVVPYIGVARPVVFDYTGTGTYLGDLSNLSGGIQGAYWLNNATAIGVDVGMAPGLETTTWAGSVYVAQNFNAACPIPQYVSVGVGRQGAGYSLDGARTVAYLGVGVRYQPLESPKYGFQAGVKFNSVFDKDCLGDSATRKYATVNVGLVLSMF